MKFEGQIKILNDLYKRYYTSNVSSFDWTIMSQNPKWMVKSNMVVVQSIPKIIVYNDQNEILKPNDYEVFLKTKSIEEWENIKELNQIPVGCIDVKIVRDQTIAYDCFYNIGNLTIDFHKQSISSTELVISNTCLDFNIKETPILRACLNFIQ